MAIIVTAPEEYYGVEQNTRVKLFLAGGITNCPDWQSEIIKALETEWKLIIYNPRRKNFPIEDPNASEKQIAWEYDKLSKADVICYWFAKGSVNPIVLYELGMWGNSRSKRIVIGYDKEYERKQDVIIQTQLARPEVDVMSHWCDNFDKFIIEVADACNCEDEHGNEKPVFLGEH